MKKNFKRGFTLVELLIVIAVLGTLAVVVLIALNPVQQLARTRDAGRDSSVAQLGRAMVARGTVLGGDYPAEPATAGTWVDALLVAPGEIQAVPANPLYSSDTNLALASGDCAGDLQDGYCYISSGVGNTTAFVIFTTAEAQSNIAQCNGDDAYFVYSSTNQRGGLWCGANPPTVGNIELGFVR